MQLPCDREVAVLARWRIRYKLLVGVVMLLLIVAMLAFSSFQGVYSYRGLARSISNRAAELPLSADLAGSVSELNSTLADVRRTDADSPWILREEFTTNLMGVRDSLRRYREELARTERSGFEIDDDSREWEAVAKIEESLIRIDELNSSEAWIFDQLEVTAMQREVETIKSLANELPTYLQQRMHGFAGDVKLQYRTWIVMAQVRAAHQGGGAQRAAGQRRAFWPPAWRTRSTIRWPRSPGAPSRWKCGCTTSSSRTTRRTTSTIRRSRSCGSTCAASRTRRSAARNHRETAGLLAMGDVQRQETDLARAGRRA
jgi:hypothetical protein